MKNATLELLENRGIQIKDIIKLTEYLKTDSSDADDIEKSILNILSIKEIQDYVTLGVILDIYTENNLLPEPLSQIISGEDQLFDLDKVLAMGVINQFGPQAVTYFSYLINYKNDVLKDILSKNTINTFLDEIICVIASASLIKLL
ncbi:hypothetical protein [Caloranaerobacter ferrireducens]|uniref:hypothetical protein n=1 Tax=Caloranaerobacter ferrireducens TaxID=1323370 RepID=UPI00084D2AA8|nr:hypothetical protein [Caloranaerobacter ferrireducens]